MDYEKEIPFGAFDSELMHQEISIPEGFTATIEGNKIILTRTENENEKIRKEIIDFLQEIIDNVGESPNIWTMDNAKKWIAWLEKQGNPTGINPSEFDLRLNELLKQFETLPKEELVNCLSFYLNVVQNDGTYKADEKQGEQPRYSIGDVLCDKSCTTLNKDAQPNFEITDIRNGMYICDKCSFPISQQDEYELVAKKIEQKPADKVEPKFHVGDWVVYECGEETVTLQITRIVGETYVFSDDSTLGVVDEDALRLWDITKDARDGDVLYFNNDISGFHSIGLFKRLTSINGGTYRCYTRYGGFNEENRLEIAHNNDELCHFGSEACPATKEQRDILMKAMADAGYTFDFQKKELKKVEDEEYNGEDYGIDSLWHAKNILEETLGKVDGYQTDDGILEHKCAITAVKKLYEHKFDWSEEDEIRIKNILSVLDVQVCWDGATGKKGNPYQKDIDWLKSLKPQNHWKPTEPQLVSLTIACNRNDRIGFDLTQLLKELKKL